MSSHKNFLRNKRSITITWQYTMYVYPHFVNLVGLKRKMTKKRGREVGGKYEFSTVWLMKENEGEGIWSGWFSTWDNTNFNPPNQREKRGWKMWKNAITILPFKPCHFLFLSYHFSTTKHKLHINFKFSWTLLIEIGWCYIEHLTLMVQMDYCHFISTIS